MFDFLFSFRGRIGRLQYFTRSIVANIVLILMAIFAIGAGVSGGHTSKTGAVGLVLLLMLPFLVVSLWISFSLQARRFRDIGWNPAYVIPGWILASVVLQIVLTPSGPSLAGQMQQLLLVGLLNFVMGGILLFWPGNGGGDIDKLASTFDLPEPDEPERTVRSMPSRPAWAPPQSQPQARTQPAPQPAYRPQPAPGGFGRRGL
jgi:uncharacterized membrane protein YhaH (DUF805 family)